MYTNDSLPHSQNLNFLSQAQQTYLGQNTKREGGRYKKIKWYSGIFKINLQIFISNDISFCFLPNLKINRLKSNLILQIILKQGFFLGVLLLFFFSLQFTKTTPDILVSVWLEIILFSLGLFFLFNHWSKQKLPVIQSTLLVEHACEHVNVYFHVRRCAWQENPCICLAQHRSVNRQNTLHIEASKWKLTHPYRIDKSIVSLS